jgi:hypothetical protein
MIRTQIQLTEDQVRSLKTLAAERQVSVAELIRQSVDHFVRLARGIDIETRRRRAIAAAGCFHADRLDISTEHDRYLVEAYGNGE